MAQMDACQDNLAVATIHQSADLVHDVLDWAAGELRANVGDDAKAASQQAAVLHFYIRTVSAAEAADARGDVSDAKTAQQIRQLALVGHHLRDARKLSDFV